MPFSENWSAYFNEAEFAVEATLTPGGTGLVIFDESGDILETFGIQHAGPIALCPASQWPGLAIGNTLTIGGTGYLIRSAPRIDDGALTLLTLARVAV
jgi:hypothetical protein